MRLVCQARSPVGDPRRGSNDLFSIASKPNEIRTLERADRNDAPRGGWRPRWPLEATRASRSPSTLDSRKKTAAIGAGP